MGVAPRPDLVPVRWVEGLEDTPLVALFCLSPAAPIRYALAKLVSACRNDRTLFDDGDIQQAGTRVEARVDPLLGDRGSGANLNTRLRRLKCLSHAPGFDSAPSRPGVCPCKHQLPVRAVENE